MVKPERRSVTSVAQEFGIVHSIVSRGSRAFRTTAIASRRRGGGRPRLTTAEDDRYIVQRARRDPCPLVLFDVAHCHRKIKRPKYTPKKTQMGKEYSVKVTLTGDCTMFKDSEHHRKRCRRFAEINGAQRTGSWAKSPPPCSRATVEINRGRPPRLLRKAVAVVRNALDTVKQCCERYQTPGLQTSHSVLPVSR
ncbi:hypothetical protein RB195_024156 [Necator americanus]|uniref:Tc3 transposase DNA binding domain-containing protein n=1 Tax=Necator americanus TaxID=51031 RepID=A0ABR1EM61_NECAM